MKLEFPETPEQLKACRVVDIFKIHTTYIPPQYVYGERDSTLIGTVSFFDNHYVSTYCHLEGAGNTIFCFEFYRILMLGMIRSCYDGNKEQKRKECWSRYITSLIQKRLGLKDVAIKAIGQNSITLKLDTPTGKISFTCKNDSVGWYMNTTDPEIGMYIDAISRIMQDTYLLQQAKNCCNFRTSTTEERIDTSRGVKYFGKLLEDAPDAVSFMTSVQITNPLNSKHKFEHIRLTGKDEICAYVDG